MNPANILPKRHSLLILRFIIRRSLFFMRKHFPFLNNTLPTVINNSLVVVNWRQFDNTLIKRMQIIKINGSYLTNMLMMFMVLLEMRKQLLLSLCLHLIPSMLLALWILYLHHTVLKLIKKRCTRTNRWVRLLIYLLQLFLHTVLLEILHQCHAHIIWVINIGTSLLPVILVMFVWMVVRRVVALEDCNRLLQWFYTHLL